MSRGSPRRSFSPMRPMNQSYSDRRRSSNYVPHQYDRQYTPNEINRTTEPQGFRSTWEEKDRAVPPMPPSPVDAHRPRLAGLHDSSYDDDRSYHPVASFRDATIPPHLERQLTPGSIAPFRDRAVTPGILTPFRDRAVTPGLVTPGGVTSFQDSPGVSYVSDERPQGNDHWSPGASQTAASSSAWDPRSQRPDQRSRPSRSDASPPYSTSRSHTDTTQRSILEPSQAWKRAREELDRQLSIEYRTIIPADHRNLPSDNYTGDGTQDNSATSIVSTDATQHLNEVQDFQARRFRQQPRPSPSPWRFDRTIIPADHRNLPSDNYTGDGTRDIGTTSTVSTNATQHSNEVQKFQMRRTRQQPRPSPSPWRFDQRTRYPDRSQTSENSRHSHTESSRRPATFSTPRRPLHRISARISARPKRSPSPTSASSDSSASAPPRSRRRSRSGSRSTRSHFSSLERESRCDIRSQSVAHNRRSSPPRRRSPEPTTRRVVSSPTRPTVGQYKPFSSHPQTLPPSAFDSTRARRPSVSSTPVANFSFRPPGRPGTMGISRLRDGNSPSRRSPSLSSQSSQSSIRSSVHSSPDLVMTEIPPDPHANNPTSAASSATDVLKATMVSEFPSPWLPPPDDADFELPGMRFQKDGALKPGLSPPSPKSGMDIHVGLLSTEPIANNLIFAAPDPGIAKVDEQAQSTTTISTEQTITHDTNGSDSAGKLETDSMPPPPTAPVNSLTCDMVVNRLSSPTQTLPSKIIISGLREARNLTASPTSKEHDVSQIIQRVEATTPVERPATPQIESIVIDSGSVAPESSPLSEPMPLSPPPDIPALQEDVEDGSSMDLDESASEAADDIAAALRVFAKAREGKDFQTRNERYEPILRANRSLLDAPCTRINTSTDDVVREVMEGSFHARLETHSEVSRSLLERFTKRSEEMAAKTRRLRAEYKSYHDRWVANCRKLDQSMASSASQGMEGLPPPSGRVTRRSTNLGDAVRSDLEMEQIIASLGNEDMTDPNVLAIRNTAVIPDLISTDPFVNEVSYKDDNGLVDDPEDLFDVYDALGRWTDEEKEIYLQKYGIYPKQFGAIASFLPGKTAAQCVMFYYLHKKELIDFRAAIATYGPKRKRRGGRKAGKGKGNALLADIVKPPRAQTEEEGTLHKHSDRFRIMPNFDGRQIPSRRRARLLQESEGEPSRPNSEISVARVSRVAALQHQEDAAGSDADSGRSSRQRQSPRIPGRGGQLSPLEDSEETGTVVITVDDRRKRQTRTLEPQDKVQEQGVSQEPERRAKPPEKGKEKEKRPPGRPPKKNRDRGKSGNKEGSSSLPHKSATSYVWSKGEEASYAELLGRHGKDFEKIAAEMPAKTIVQCRNYFRSHAKDRDLDRIAKESEKSTAVDNSASSKTIPTTGQKDKAISKGTKAKDVVNGEVDTGGSALLRGQRSRQPDIVYGSMGEDEEMVPDPVSAALNAIFKHPDSPASKASSSTKEASKRLPNFTKSKRQDT